MPTNSHGVESGRLKVAVWGLGAHAFKNVLPAIGASEAAALVGVCSRDAASRLRASSEYGCAAWDDADAMLADARVDTVYLATPIGLHFEQGLRALEAGRHLICEKSLTDACDKSVQLVAEARKRRLMLCEAFMYQFLPRIRSVYELVQREEFGAVVAVSCDFYLPNPERPGYRFSPQLGGGAFLDVGCYPISFLHGLGRGPRVVAQAGFHRRSGVEVDVGGMAMVRWGAQAHAALGWGYGAAYRNEATIIGERQSLQVDQVFAKGGERCATLVLRDAQGRENRHTFESADGFVEMLACARKALFNEEMKETLWVKAEQQANLMEQVRAGAAQA
jgi:NDP-hexose-3-ketoreductase